MSHKKAMTVDSHFDGRPTELRANYQRVLKAVQEFGPFEEAPKQASIHFQRDTVFADVQLRKDYFYLEFKTDYPIDHPRVTKFLQLSAHRYAHTVKIASASDIDAQLLKWLKDAYDLCK